MDEPKKLLNKSSSPFWVHWILNKQKKDLNPKLEKILILNEPKKLNTLKTFFHAQCVEMNSKEASYLNILKRMRFYEEV